MVFTIDSSKVTPISVTPRKKKNNFMEQTCDLVREYKIIIYTELIIGINRLHLLKCGSWTINVCYTYTFVLVLITAYAMVPGETKDNSFIILKEINCLEFILLITASLFYKSRFIKLIKDLTFFDEMLNVRKQMYKAVKIYTSIGWMFLSLFYSIIECSLVYYWSDRRFGEFLSVDVLFLYFLSFAHDSEQIFFVTMIKSITVRVRILKAHVEKIFKKEIGVTDWQEENTEKSDDIEVLANNVQLATSEMHRAYELLNKCAEQLNTIMSFPMLVMLFTSGLCTIMLLKEFFKQTGDTNLSQSEFKSMLVYTWVRCFKYTFLIVVPCYFANVTSRQVSIIRSTLHTAVNTFKLEKIERRKVKAFFLLTQDSEFVYAFWGVIRLSMSLPLSYASLCITYLVICIQFSKFID